MTTRSVTTDQETASADLPSLIKRLAMAMERDLDAGERAQLRRLDVKAPDQPAFWKLMAAWIAPERPLSPPEETRWAIILSNMARMWPSCHQPGRSVGRVLAETNYQEIRLMRLLRTHGPTFADAVRRMCGFLASRAEPVDWAELAALILTSNPDKAETLRRKIARVYYQTIQRKEKKP